MPEKVQPGSWCYGEMVRVFHCTRAFSVLLGTAALLGSATSKATAQAPQESAFTIYIRSSPVGTERVSVARSADGFTITSTGRIGAPVDLVIREFTEYYDSAWKPLDLTIDASVRGQGSTLHTTVSGTTATTELTGAPGSQPLRRTDTIDPQALFMPNPFIAPYEAVSARASTAAPGTSLSLYQPG